MFVFLPNKCRHWDNEEHIVDWMGTMEKVLKHILIDWYQYKVTSTGILTGIMCSTDTLNIIIRCSYATTSMLTCRTFTWIFFLKKEETFSNPTNIEELYVVLFVSILLLVTKMFYFSTNNESKYWFDVFHSKFQWMKMNIYIERHVQIEQYKLNYEDMVCILWKQNKSFIDAFSSDRY